MFKLFGFRITPLFLFILGLECLALLISLYLGILLYNGASINISNDTFNHVSHTGVVLFVLIMILTPGFFSQLKIIHHLKKSFNELMPGIAASILSMLMIVTANHSNMDSRLFFLAAILSASIGLIINKLSLTGKYWRFLVRKDVN